MNKPVVANTLDGSLKVVASDINGLLIPPNPDLSADEHANQVADAIRSVVQSKFNNLQIPALKSFY